MLARSYTVLGRYAEAVPAYARATELQPQNASLLADYADTVAATKRTANNPESIALIERALAIDPSHPKALALAGTVDYDRGDYARAIAPLADDPRARAARERARPADRGEHRRCARAARRRGAAGDGERLRAGAAQRRRPRRPAPARPRRPRRWRRPASAARSRSIPRSPPRPRPATPCSCSPAPPAAAGCRSRCRGPGSPTCRLRFKLDDSMAMAPGMTVSSAKQVIVAARISKSGQATPSAGDLSGESAPVATGRDERRGAHRPRRRDAVGAGTPAATRVALSRAACRRPGPGCRAGRRSARAPSISPARSASRASGLNSSASIANTGAPS